MSRLFAAAQAQAGARPIRPIIAHPGGRDVLNALESVFPDYSFAASRRVLRDCGNMSSPSVLFTLEEAMRDGQPSENEDWWLVSLGARFSAHACRFSAI